MRVAFYESVLRAAFTLRIGLHFKSLYFVSILTTISLDIENQILWISKYVALY